MDTSTAPSVSNIHPDSEPAQPTPSEPSEHFDNHPAPVENPAVLQWLVGTGSAPTLGIEDEDDTESSLFSAYRSAIVPRFELANLPSLSARHSNEPKCMAAIERMRAIYTDPAFARAHPAGDCECDSLHVVLMHGELDALPGVLLACDGRREDMQIEMEMERMGMNEEERARAEIRRMILQEIRTAAILERRAEELKRRKIPKFQPDPAMVAWMQSFDEEMARRFGIRLPDGFGSYGSSMPVAGNDTAKEDMSS